MRKVSFKIGVGDSKVGLPSVERLVEVGLEGPFFVMAGPCVIESRDITLDIANRLAEIGAKSDVGMIFKASFDKANRSSISSYRGPGLEEGLDILAEVRRETNLPVMTDVHEASQAAVAAEVVDCLQVPAFLCRQTDLLCACGRTGRAVNVKKGQYLSPGEMKNVVEKIVACNNEKIILAERGTFFGYSRLVNDMTAIDTMKKLGFPVVFDATHSTQQPGGLGNASAGQREMSPILAKAAIAAGANGLFVEVHTEPEKSKSDAACIMPIDWLEELLKVCREIFEIVRR
jgi:2-dehydro-3-deoxyphosphooctonate aldolase (KDO 8-P synthase)